MPDMSVMLHHRGRDNHSRIADIMTDRCAETRSGLNAFSRGSPRAESAQQSDTTCKV